MWSQKFVVVVTLSATLALIATPAWAKPGPAPEGAAIAEYNRATGRVLVSFADLQREINGGYRWELTSESNSLSGETPLNLPTPTALNPFFFDSDSSIGVIYAVGPPVTPWTDVDLDLGLVAKKGLLPGDLIIRYSTAFGIPFGTVTIVPEPEYLAWIMLALLTANSRSAAQVDRFGRVNR